MTSKNSGLKHKDLPQPSSSLKAENPKIVLWLGFVMFLSSFSFIMIYSIFPAYLLTLGYSQTSIGTYEGLFEAISQLMKFSFGIISDLLRRRKLLIFLGCGIMFLGRSAVAFTTNISGLIFGRALERIGNGAYSSPRDALIAAASSKENRGQSFGLVRSLGQLGPILGGITTAYLMNHFGFSFREIFVGSMVPALIILLIVSFKIKEIPFEEKKTKKRFQWEEIRKIGPKFALLMVVHFIFSLGRCNEAFMGMYAIKHFNLSYENVPYIMVFFNLSWACVSYPVGLLADRIGRFEVLAVGIGSLIIADFLFFNATNLLELFVGAIFWGMQMGITTNAFTSLISDTVSPNLRGTAFGIFFLISALCLFIADSIGGYIADIYGNNCVYLYSMVWGVLSLSLLMVIMKYQGAKLSE